MFRAWYVAISRSRPWWASHSAAAAARWATAKEVPLPGPTNGCLSSV